MAITVANGGSQGPLGNGTYCASTKAIWTPIHTLLTATASTAAQAKNPGSRINTDANAILVKVPDNATRCRIRGRCSVGLTVLGTLPVVKVLGMYTSESNLAASPAALPSDATWERLDATTFAATGTTLTFALASADTQLIDATYLYTDVSSDIDCKGAQYVAVLPTTAWSGSTGATVAACDISFISP